MAGCAGLTQADIDQLAADVVLIRIISREMVSDNVRLKKDASDMRGNHRGKAV